MDEELNILTLHSIYTTVQRKTDFNTNIEKLRLV